MKPTIYQIDGSNLTDLERVLALQFAEQIMESKNLPDTPNRDVMNALCFAFMNGCSFRRNLTAKQEREMTENYQPLIDHLFYGGACPPEMVNNENFN